MADVLNLDANHWLECGGRSNADHARERPGRHLDNYGLWSCWLVDRYIPGASSRVVCDRAVRWLFDVDLGRDVPTFSLSVFSALASQRLTNRRARDFWHLVEVVEKSDSNYIRCTYSFDEAGRPTGRTNYDASGKILDKSTVEYRDDAHGNWIEKKAIVWDTKSEPMKQKIVVTNLRTIS